MGSSPSMLIQDGDDIELPVYGEVDIAARGVQNPEDETVHNPTVRNAGMLQAILVDLQCSICLEIMNSEELRPKQLDCGHTLCQLCAAKSIQRGRLNCPHCRRPTTCSRVQDIADNQALKAIADTAKTIKQQLEVASSDSEDTVDCHCGRRKCRERCKNCKKLMCTDCALHTGCSAANDSGQGRHNAEKLDEILKAIKTKLTGRHDFALMEMTKLLELLNKAKILKESKNVMKLLNDGDKVADDLDRTAVLFNQPPRSLTQTSRTLLPPIDMLQRARTAMGDFIGDGVETFNTAVMISQWQVEDASCVLALVKGGRRSTIITSNKRSKGMLTFNVNGETVDTFFPQIGSFRGICSLNQTIYVISDGQSDVRASSDSAQFVQAFSDGGSIINRFKLNRNVRYASGIAACAGNIYVVDTESCQVCVLSAQNGLLLSRISHPDLRCPYGVAVYNNNILVTDHENHRVVSLTDAGQLNWSYGSEGGAARGKLNKPLGIACDEKGQIYIADWGNSRVTVLHSNGEYKMDILTPQQINCPMTLSVHKDLLVVKQENRHIKTFQLKHQVN